MSETLDIQAHLSRLSLADADNGQDRVSPEISSRSSSLSTLPTELLLRIISFLHNKIDVACLLLASRNIYTRATEKDFWELFRAPPSPVPGFRTGHLVRLCRDLKPSHIFCNACYMLHPLGPHLPAPSPEKFCFTNQLETPGSCPTLRHIGPVWWDKWRLSFIDVYPVMLRHKLGEPHGLPLSSLSFSSDWSHLPLRHDPPRLQGQHTCDHAPYHYVKLDMAASVVENNLIMHTTQRLWIPLKMSSKIFHFPLSVYDGENLNSGFRVCKHQAIRLGWGKENHTDAPELTWAINHQLECLYLQRRRKSTTHHDAAMHARAKKWRCTLCGTVATLKIHDHGARGIEMVLDTWQEIGWCSHPSNLQWAQCWRNPGDDKSVIAEYRAGDAPVVRHLVNPVARSDRFLAPKHRPVSLVPPGKSALDHESAPAAWKHFRKIQASRRKRSWSKKLLSLQRDQSSWRVRGAHPMLEPPQWRLKLAAVRGRSVSTYYYGRR